MEKHWGRAPCKSGGGTLVWQVRLSRMMVEGQQSREGRLSREDGDHWRREGGGWQEYFMIGLTVRDLEGWNWIRIR